MDNKTSIILSATDKTQAAFASAKRNLEGLKNAAGGLNTALASVGAGLSVGAFAAFVKNSIDAADNLNDLSKKTGIAVENLAGLQLVVDKSGTTMEMLGGGVAKLNKTMGEAARGSKDAQTVLRDLGITATDPMEAFYQLADAFGRFKTEGDKADAMSRVIGKTWGELAPALAEGGAGLRAMVEEGKRLNPVTKEMAEQADKFNDAMSRFKTQASGFGTAIATSILPGLNEMFEQLNEGIRIFGSFGSAVKNLGLISPFQSLVDGLAEYRGELKRLQGLQAGSRPEIAAMLEPQIQQTKKKLEYLKYLQRQEALSLLPEHQRQTAKNDQPAPITPTKSGSGKTAKPKENPLTTQSKADALRDFQLFDLPAFEAELADWDDVIRRSVEEANEQFRMVDGPQFDAEGTASLRLRQMADELNNLLDPIQKYRDELDKIDELLDAGLISPEKAAAARLYWNEQMDAAAGFGAEITKVRSLTEDLGLTFESAFEGAIVEGKALSDVLNSLAQDVTRVFLRKTVTEPLGNWASSFFAGLFPSALGNVFAGGVPVRAFSAGGVVSSPTVFPLGLMGEAGPEAIMPLKRGRDGKLGVTGGGGTTINMVVHANDANSVRASMGQIKADLARAVSSARRNL